MRDGIGYARPAVSTSDQVIWAEQMPAGASQKAELTALTKARELGHGRKINIYTGSCYAFATALVLGAMFKERGLLTAERKTVKNKEEIQNILKDCGHP